MEPDALTIEDKADYVGESARAKASTLGEVDVVANLAFEPLFFVDVNGHRRVTAFSDSAAATRVAVGKVRAMLDDIECASIGTNNALTV
jgi:hypothetical protein